MNIPVIFVRFHPHVMGQRDQVCHMVPIPLSGAVPESLTALCGQVFWSGGCAPVTDFDGQPCFPCLMALGCTPVLAPPEPRPAKAHTDVKDGSTDMHSVLDTASSDRGGVENGDVMAFVAGSAENHLRIRLQGEAQPPLRAGVAGLGMQAQNDHLPALVASDLTTLVAVCDVDDHIASETSTKYGVTGYTRVLDMLVNEQLDFVVIAVPHHAGREVISLAAQHGVHVLKEKPFATSLSEARELAAICGDAGIELMVTLQRRFNPIYTTFHQLYDQIGRPFLINAAYTMSVDPASGWRGQSRLAGGGCIIDMGYHVIDMLLWYFGLPDRVLAQHSATARPDLSYDVEDTATIAFGYDSGLFGNVLLSRCVSPKTEMIRVVGTRGTVVLERGRIQRLQPDGRVIEALSREQSWPTAATAQVDHFCRVVRGQRPNHSSPESHLAHAAFIDACYSSRDTCKFVDPKELLA